MTNESPSPLFPDWMIYPGVKQAVRICALAFCAGILLTVLAHLLLPALMHFPAMAPMAGRTVQGAALAEGIAIIALAVLLPWGARALLASRGNYVTRILSGVAALPALYALLILLSPQPPILQFMEMEKTLEATFLLAGITAFFSYPYTQGYPPAWRKRFLAWAVLAVCYALQGILFSCILLLWNLATGSIPPLLPGTLMALSGLLELALGALSILLGWTLNRRVMQIASMPERHDPSFPEKS